MVKNIKELFLAPSYKIVVFEGSSFHYTASGYTVCYSTYNNKNANSVCNEFSNNRILNSGIGYKMLGKVSELTDKKCEKVFKEALMDRYPNFESPSESFTNPLESIHSLLKIEGYTDYSKVWIIIPEPSKKLTGHKIMVKFNVARIGFDTNELGGSTYYEDMELPVYMSDFKNPDIKEIKYGVEIPDHIYRFLMSHPDMDKRPKSKTFFSETFSSLHQHLNELSQDAVALVELDKDMKSVDKVILLNFNSGQVDTRDEYYFGYTGKKTAISFQYFVGYKSKERRQEGLLKRFSTNIHVDKKYFSGEGFKTVGGRLIPVLKTEGYIIIEWTQEREDFLKQTESNFKKLSDKLSEYLNDMTPDKLELLMASGLKMLGTSEENK